MKISGRNLGILIVVAVIVVVGAVFLMHNVTSSKPPAVNAVSPTIIYKSPTLIPSPAASASPTAVTTQFSAPFRAQVRADFISDCSKVVGQNGVSVCTCTADYLAAHYTDTQLVKLFLDYHSSGKVPVEVKTAVHSCSAK